MSHDEIYDDEFYNMGEGDGGLMNENVRGIPDGWYNSYPAGVGPSTKWDGAASSLFQGPPSNKEYRKNGFGVTKFEGAEDDGKHGRGIFHFFFGRHKD